MVFLGPRSAILVKMSWENLAFENSMWKAPLSEFSPFNSLNLLITLNYFTAPKPPKKMKCSDCPFVTSVSVVLLEHTRMHQIVTEFRCPHCSFRWVQYMHFCIRWTFTYLKFYLVSIIRFFLFAALPLGKNWCNISSCILEICCWLRTKSLLVGINLYVYREGKHFLRDRC